MCIQINLKLEYIALKRFEINYWGSNLLYPIQSKCKFLMKNRSYLTYNNKKTPYQERIENIVLQISIYKILLMVVKNDGKFQSKIFKILKLLIQFMKT